MKKRSVYLILGFILVIFTVIVFTAPINRTPVFWISYIFGLVALCFQTTLCNKNLFGESLKSKFFAFPIIYIGAVYLILQLTISIVMMAVPDVPVWIAIIVDVVILGITSTLVIFGEVARTSIEKTEDKVQTKTTFIKRLKSDVEILLVEEKDPEIKKELSKLDDEIRFSDPMSCRELEDIENQISVKVASIANSGDAKLELISEIIGLIKERNIRCRSLK